VAGVADDEGLGEDGMSDTATDQAEPPRITVEGLAEFGQWLVTHADYPRWREESDQWIRDEGIVLDQ